MTGEPEDIENEVTSDSCQCPVKVNVDECSCKYMYGRRGYECHNTDDNPINGACYKDDINPVECSNKCSKYVLFYKLSFPIWS